MFTFKGISYPTIDDAIIDNLTWLSDREVEPLYEDFLDDVYGEIDCKFATYSASYLMKEMDPTLYRCEFADYISEVFREIDGLYYDTDKAQDIEDQCELSE